MTTLCPWKMQVGAWGALSGALCGALAGAVVACHGSGGLGAACKGNSDCKAAHECIEEQCLRSCTTDAECSDVPDFKCGTIQMTRSSGGVKLSTRERPMCVPRAEEDHTLDEFQASLVGIQATAAAERENVMKALGDELSAQLKAGLVMQQISLACNTANTPHPTQAAFDAAWQALPAEHRKAASEDELVKELLPQLLKPVMRPGKR